MGPCWKSCSAVSRSTYQVKLRDHVLIKDGSGDEESAVAWERPRISFYFQTVQRCHLSSLLNLQAVIVHLIWVYPNILWPD